MRLINVETKKGVQSRTRFIVKHDDGLTLFYKGKPALEMQAGQIPRVDMSLFKTPKAVTKDVCKLLNKTKGQINKAIKEKKVLDTSHKVFYTKTIEQAGYMFYKRDYDLGGYILLNEQGEQELWYSTQEPQGNVLTIKRLPKSYLEFICKLD